MQGISLLVAATLFMEFFDATALTPALPKIAAKMGVHAVDLNSAVAAYALTMSVFIVPSGWLAERFGARRVFPAAIVAFTLTSALCAVAWSPASLTVSRALQGISGSMMVPVGRLIVLRMTPKSELMRTMARLVWPGLTAPLIAPVVGGYLTDAFSWRMIFLVNLPLGLCAFILSLALTPEFGSLKEKPFDWLGFCLAGAFITALINSLDALASAGEIVSFVPYALGATLLLVILARHLSRSPHPLVDFAPMEHITFRKMLVGGTAARALISAIPFLLPLAFQLYMGYDALTAGLALTPLFLGNIFIKPFTTPLIAALGFRRVLIINGLIQSATIAACGLLSANTPKAWVAALLFLSGASRSTHFTALTTLALADVPSDQMNMANSLTSTAFHLSFAFGVAIGATLVRLGRLWHPDDGLMQFQFAFFVLASLMILVVADHAKLPAHSGRHVAIGQRPGRDRTR